MGETLFHDTARWSNGKESQPLGDLDLILENVFVYIYLYCIVGAEEPLQLITRPPPKFKQ